MRPACTWFAQLAVLMLGVVGTANLALAREGEVGVAGTAMLLTAGRETRDLSGHWRYLIDSQRLGVRKPGTRRDFAADTPDRNHPLIEYAWDTAPTVTVPGDWNSQVRELFWYEGMVWYRRTFDASRRADRRYFLQFEAVNYHAHVYLNGRKLGEHKGGFTPFEFEVTEQLRDGSNSLVVAADNKHDEQSLPNVDFDWHNYGGITRPVHLIEVPETYVHDWRIGLDDKDRLSGVVRLRGPAAGDADVTLRIPELGLERRLRTNIQGEARFDIAIPAGLQRWSPTRPRLYGVEFRHGTERLEDRVGFRRVEVRGPRILLNGDAVILRGIALHEETLGSNPGRAMSAAAARALLMEAKALGANFVRLAHYPHSETMTRLADELGLLVWSEIPVYWEMDYADPVLLAAGRAMLREMIARDINRASIIIWAIANETPVEPARNEFLRHLIVEARAQDPSRLIAAALDMKPGQETPDDSRGVIRVNDPIGAYLDVLGFNRYDGWYGELTPPQIDSVRWESMYEKPLILSEFGADALHGYRADAGVRWSEDYQAELFRRFIAMTERIPNFAGTSAWLLKDFRSPRRFHGRFQNYWNRKGVIDENGRRKLAFYILRDWYMRTQPQD